VLNIRTAQSRKYISRHDDAVDRKKLGKSKTWTRFVDGEIDVDKVPIRPGFKPAVFSLRRLSRAQFLYVSDRPTELLKWQEACAYGLAGWTDFGDAVLEVEDTTFGDRITNQCLDKIFIPEIVEEIGQIIVSMSMLGPTKEPG
jgi:hypothetical protein